MATATRVIKRKRKVKIKTVKKCQNCGKFAK